ncbi:MAG: DUF362 domain-containing protein [Desulfobacterales bacterium]|nr:DUF362 domain-containing protein [Desulfobacterales bacterium]
MKDETKRKLTRRQFIKHTSMATIGGSIMLSSHGSVFSETEPSAKSTQTDVVLVRNREVLDKRGKPNIDVVLEMLDVAVSSLTGETDSVAGWRTLIKPEDVVGIKTNVWSPIGTTKAIEQSLKARVMRAGVSEHNISISDRNVLHEPVFKKATALINARPMRSHHWSGVGSLIKNYIMFVPDPYNYHEDSCARLGEIWTYPIVKDKTRLNVLVMFTPQFNNVGPHGFSPRHVWKYYGLIVGFDPVAIDTIGVKIIQGIRNEYFGEERPLTPPPHHIELADTKYRIGTADLSKINLIKIGYDKGSFC